MTIHVDTVEGVATITMSKPPHNFLDADLLTGVAAAIRAQAVAGARVAVVRSDVRSFCAGLDFRSADGLGDDATRDRFFAAVDDIADAPIPLLAAVHGAAVGGGLGLALLCDVRIATPTATFACNFVRYALYPGFGITYTLPSLVGSSYGNWLMMSGRQIAAADALRVGLVDQLADPEELHEVVHRAALEIAGAGARPVAELHRRRRQEFASEVARASVEERRIKVDMLGSAEFHERIAPVRANRQPLFGAEAQ